MNLFKPAAAEPEPDLVDAEQLRQLAAELTTTLDGSDDWQRLDADSFVSAGHRDGQATIVGNTGGWWLVRPGPGDSHVAQPMPSAHDALEGAGL